MSYVTVAEKRFFEYLELDGEDIEMWKVINGGYDPDLDKVPSEDFDDEEDDDDWWDADDDDMYDWDYEEEVA